MSTSLAQTNRHIGLFVLYKLAKESPFAPWCCVFQIGPAIGQWQKIEAQQFLDFLEIIHQEAYIQRQTLHIVCSVVGNDWYQKLQVTFQLLL